MTVTTRVLMGAVPPWGISSCWNVNITPIRTVW